MSKIIVMHQWPSADETGEPVYQFELAESSQSNNAIKDMHFHDYKKLRTRISALLQAQLPSVRPEPIERAYLVVERHSAGSLDWDNAYGGLKPILDSLVRCTARSPSGLGVIRDDNPKGMPYPPYVTQHTAKKNQGKTVIKVYALQ